MMGTSIPLIRQRLHEMADEYGIDELHYWAEETRRNPPVRLTKPQSQPMTPELAREIKLYAFWYPEASHQQIGWVFHVNDGRVSEALNGLWEGS
jgi:hypothetical protein